MSWFFKSWRPAEKKDQARELRIATTSESSTVQCSGPWRDQAGCHVLAML